MTGLPRALLALQAAPWLLGCNTYSDYCDTMEVTVACGGPGPGEQGECRGGRVRREQRVTADRDMDMADKVGGVMP
jgi:hypothetical protein